MKRTYYIYVVDKNKYVKMNLRDLKRFVKKLGEGYFGNTPKQTRKITFSYTSKGYNVVKSVTKPIDYILYDNDLNLVDYALLEDYVFRRRYCKQFPSYFSIRHKDFYNKYEFRKDPIESTFKNGTIKEYWRTNYRNPKIAQEKRITCDDTHKEFSRGKRRNLPSDWDSVIPLGRNSKKSWKNLKVRKQYMKNI